MKKLAVALTMLFLSLSSAKASEVFNFDPNHTVVVWHANHFGFSNPSGKFTDVSGSLVLDEQKPENSKVNVKITIASLDTGLTKLDNHVKSADFLDAEKYPTATFSSDKVVVTSKTTAKVYGSFELRGVTKPVVLDVTLNKIGDHPMTKKKAVGFTASTVIKRSDYGVNYALPGVSDDVKIDIEAEAQVVDAK